MPRINAPSVAEHHAAQERALLDAAHALLRETHEAPTMAQVAERAGLARSSVYQYFGSRQEILLALVADVFPRWTDRIAAAMEGAESASDAALAYACENLALVAEGSHEVASALAGLSPGLGLDERASAMHRQLQEPLVKALAEFGVESAESVAEMVNAMVYAGSRMLETGQSLEDVTGYLALLLRPPTARRSGPASGG
jgi:AcrR family transcriptional regulator